MKIGERDIINKELMQLFGDLDTLLFVWISQLLWIGHVNRMDSRRNPEGNRLRRRLKNRLWNCVQRVINKFEITDWSERSKNSDDWGKSIKEAKIRFGLQCHRIIIRRHVWLMETKITSDFYVPKHLSECYFIHLKSHCSDPKCRVLQSQVAP